MVPVLEPGKRKAILPPRDQLRWALVATEWTEDRENEGIGGNKKGLPTKVAYGSSSSFQGI